MAEKPIFVGGTLPILEETHHFSCTLVCNFRNQCIHSS